MGKLVGIDLGTTNSLVAHDAGNGPRVLPHPAGGWHVPSAVRMDSIEGLLVGKAAREGLGRRPEDAILSVKRHMGTDRKFLLGGEELSPQAVSALILKELKLAAEAALQAPVDRAVISVPAYFNEVQRRATREAGEIAGLRIDRLINEPTAAALAYGIDRLDTSGCLLVYDLGGGTFDVTVLEMFEGVFSVRASGGDSRLGGDDFDDRVARWIAGRLASENGWGEIAPQGHVLLRLAVENAKVALSQADEADVIAEGLKLVDGSRRSLKAKLTRERFEKLTRELLERTGRAVLATLGEARLTKERVSEVILVGGSTRMPCVARYLAELLGKAPQHIVDPMQAVALGAAVQARMLDGGSRLDEVVVTDVSPFTLGVAVLGEHGGELRPGVFDPLIHRNTSLPARRTKEFSTQHPEQETVAIEIFQGDDPLVENNVFLERYYLGGIPTNTGRTQALDITFRYDVDGILQVDAVIKATGKSAGIRIDPSRMRCVGDGLVAARTKVQDLWQRHRVYRRLRTLLHKRRAEVDGMPQAERLVLLERLNAAQAALESGDTEAMSRIADDLQSLEGG